MGTAIYLLTNHISEVQYNNWGNGVWNGLLEIQSDGNCNGNTQDEKYYKACIKKDINDYYDLKDMWNNNYWKQRYQTQISLQTGDSADRNKQKFQKLGSWEKFREVCTKGIDEMIKNQNWNKLFNALGAHSSSSTNIQSQDGITYDECWQQKSTTTKK